MYGARAWSRCRSTSASIPVRYLYNAWSDEIEEIWKWILKICLHRNSQRSRTVLRHRAVRAHVRTSVRSPRKIAGNKQPNRETPFRPTYACRQKWVCLPHVPPDQRTDLELRLHRRQFDVLVALFVQALLQVLSGIFQSLHLIADFLWDWHMS